MDDIERHWMEQRQKRYRELYRHENYARAGGIFSKKKRKQLLDVIWKSGGKAGHGKSGLERRTLSNFWYDARESVKTALIDLQLFLETANDKDVDAVITPEALSGVLSFLLDRSRGSGERAKVAQLLAEQSLEYLRHKSKYVTKSQGQILDDAIEASKQLTLLLLPEKERDSFSWKGESRW